MKYFYGWYECIPTTTTFDDLEWCELHFGPPGKHWMYQRAANTLYFKNEKDRNWFILKWQ
jgi:hypothetical protein